MGIIFALCCLLLSPIVLFTYGVVKHLHLLHEDLCAGRAKDDSATPPDAPVTIPIAYSRK